jgi:hypothetical protein
MGIEFDTVLMPHRKLLLGVTEIGLPRKRVPCPYLEWIEQVQLSGQLTGGQLSEPTNEVAVNVIRMIFIFGKGSVSIDIANANLPELLR